jgi:putative SOS response-associated peptidase YedK
VVLKPSRFLTTEPNALVRQYHPKAMPVILTTQKRDRHLDGGSDPVALELQRPLPDDALAVGGRGSKQDP